jgi:hypothetical protein
VVVVVVVELGIYFFDLLTSRPRGIFAFTAVLVCFSF